MTRDEIIQLIKEQLAADKSSGQYGISAVPYHVHNNLDAPQLSFLGLSDAPNSPAKSYKGQNGNPIAVNGTETGLEFTTFPPAEIIVTDGITSVEALEISFTGATVTDGGGGTADVTITASGIAAAGSDTDVQFNSSGLIAGNGGLTYTSGNTLGIGGHLSLIGDNTASSIILSASTSGTGTTFNMTGSDGNSGGGAGGTMFINAGNAVSIGGGGGFIVAGGQGAGTSNGGPIQLAGGAAAGSGNGGTALLEGGNGVNGGSASIFGGSGSGGNGGTTFVFGGLANSANKNGGDVLLAGGAGNGSGHAGNLFAGNGILATTATGGFLVIPQCAGTPTGVPAGGNGSMVYDTVNNKLYIYNGAWKSVTLT